MPAPELLEPDAASLVSDVHRAGTRFVLATTGGGSGAISALLTVPGGSRTVLEASVPYSAAALTAFLAAQPEQFCSEYTARLMAMAAYQRATRYATDGHEPTAPLAGIGGTASLASDRPKRGAHRIHVAAQTAELTAVASLDLTKGVRTRAQEETLATRLLLNMVARACGLPDRLLLDLQAAEQVVEDGTIAPPEWRQLFAGEVYAVPGKVPSGHDSQSRVPCGHQEPATAPPLHKPPSAKTAPPSEPHRLVFPGAFHPLHDGHREMARIAAAHWHVPVEWELSITNVDKPPLDYHEMRLRAAQFPADASLWLTRAPTFVEKARIFPGATFIVGADTIARIAEPRYYGGDPVACQQAFAAIAAAGCRFLVFGRKIAERFETLGDLSLPPTIKAICDEVSPSAFRADISSTELRR